MLGHRLQNAQAVADQGHNRGIGGSPMIFSKQPAAGLGPPPASRRVSDQAWVIAEPIISASRFTNAPAEAPEASKAMAKPMSPAAAVTA